MVAAEYLRQCAGTLYDISRRVRCGKRDDTLLQIDQDQRGLHVESGQGHGVLLVVIGAAMDM